MHVLLVADGRSPITQRWIQGLMTLGHRVTLVSSFPCSPVQGVEETFVLPVAFGNLGGSQVKTSGGTRSGGIKSAVARSRSIFLWGRYVLGPLSLPFYGRQLVKIVEKVKPDLVHGMRIPFEGMLSAYTPANVPLVVSIWGNDLTLHARGSAMMGSMTLRTLRRADGLMADTRRDIRLGKLWGFQAEKPTLTVPGAGGIDLSEMHRLRTGCGDVLMDDLPCGLPLVINPRGFRPGSVRNDVFFQAIPMVLERNPKVYFACVAMAGQPEALNWVQRMKLGQNVRLLPYLSQAQLWDLFSRAEVSVSLSVHDGTPNSLLEAMACGCFPVAGDIESLREWITPGVNGLLVEPIKPQALADALLLALDQPELRRKAAEHNLQLITNRAEVGLVRAQVEVFYQRVVASKVSSLP